MKSKLIISFLVCIITISSFSLKNVNAGFTISDSFTYEEYVGNIYPSHEGGLTDINFYIKSWGSVYTGQYMVYLQRPVEGEWITVGHTGVPRYGEKDVTFTREYSGLPLYKYTPYRFLLHYDDYTNSKPIYYRVIAY
jgi:hypothetical protein